MLGLYFFRRRQVAKPAGPEPRVRPGAWTSRPSWTTGVFIDTFASGGGLDAPQFLTFTPIPEPGTLKDYRALRERFCSPRPFVST